MGLFGGTQRIAPSDHEPLEELPPPVPQASTTILAEGMTLKGTICGEGVVQIEGAVEGEITLDGTAAVSPAGTVAGPITASIVRIAGNVQGDIQAREQLRLNATGSIEGDIQTPSLVVEEGGVLNGRASMTNPRPPRLSQGGPRISDLQFGSNYNPEEASEP